MDRDKVLLDLIAQLYGQVTELTLKLGDARATIQGYEEDRAHDDNS